MNCVFSVIRKQTAVGATHVSVMKDLDCTLGMGGVSNHPKTVITIATVTDESTYR